MKPGDIEPSFSIPTTNFNDLREHARNCKSVIDESIIISCADGWFSVDMFDRFETAQSKRVDNSLVKNFGKQVTKMRTSGKFSSFYENESGTLSTLQNTGGLNYYQKIYDAQTIDYKDVVLTSDLFILLIYQNFQESLQVFSSQTLKHLYSIQMLNGEAIKVQSFDQVKDLSQTGNHHVYTVFKNFNDKYALAELEIEDPAKEGDIEIKYHNEVFESSPNNCGNRMKVTELLLILACTET